MDLLLSGTGRVLIKGILAVRETSLPSPFISYSPLLGPWSAEAQSRWSRSSSGNSKLGGDMSRRARNAQWWAPFEPKQDRYFRDGGNSAGKWTGSDFGKIQRRQSLWTLPLLVGKRKKAQQKTTERPFTATGQLVWEWTKATATDCKIGKRGAASRWYKNGVKRMNWFMQTAKSFQLWYGNRMLWCTVTNLQAEMGSGFVTKRRDWRLAVHLQGWSVVLNKISFGLLDLSFCKAELFTDYK